MTALDCHLRRGHRYLLGSVRCCDCWQPRTFEEAMEADEVRSALYDEQLADFEASGNPSEGERDAHRGWPE